MQIINFHNHSFSIIFSDQQNQGGKGRTDTLTAKRNDDNNDDADTPLQIGDGQLKDGQEQGRQQGQKHLNDDLQNSSLDTIVDLVVERIKARPVFSTWQYYDRAAPTSTSAVNDSRLPEFAYESKVTKSDLNDSNDIKKALSKVPKAHKPQALKLLSELEKRSSQITFDCKGVIYIDGDAIPQSNFFTFFPLLYKKRIPKTLPGFSDFLVKLQSMGLKELFPLEKQYKSKLKLTNAISKELSSKSSSVSNSWWLLN